MLARTPWTPVYEAKPKAKPKRLSTRRKHTIRDRIVIIMRLVQPTPFAVEGPCRYGVRSSLCLQGWSWPEADAVAIEIVTAALNILGAKRPTWAQGQPEWTQPGVLPILRERCVRCRKPLPEGHRKFCSKVCGDSYHGHLAHLRRRDEINAVRRARMAAWTARQPARACEGCERHYKPRTPGQRFCSGECVGRTYGGRQ